MISLPNENTDRVACQTSCCSLNSFDLLSSNTSKMSNIYSPVKHSNASDLNLTASICTPEVKIAKYNIRDLGSLRVSTNTFIAITNAQIDTDLFFQYAPVCNYQRVEKSKYKSSSDRRKAQVDAVSTNKTLPKGSLIYLKKGKLSRGVNVRRNKQSKKSCFLNSVSVDMLLEHDKIVNIKVSKNGKLQVTGCRTEQHFIDCVLSLYKLMKINQNRIGQVIVSIPDNANFQCIFDIVMINYQFDFGFRIDREKLDTYFNENTEFISMFEAFLNPGVRIRKEALVETNDSLLKIELQENLTAESSIVKSKISFDQFFASLSLKDQDKALNRKKRHTFICFNSGNCILSSRGSYMPEIYKQFVRIIYENRHVFEEKLKSKT